MILDRMAEPVGDEWQGRMRCLQQDHRLLQVMNRKELQGTSRKLVWLGETQPLGRQEMRDGRLFMRRLSATYGRLFMRGWRSVPQWAGGLELDRSARNAWITLVSMQRGLRSAIYAWTTRPKIANGCEPEACVKPSDRAQTEAQRS